MTYLELCKLVADEIGLHGAMSDVNSSQPLHIDVANAVRSAWVSLQQHNSVARFMQATKSFTTTPSVSSYAKNVVIADGSCGRIIDIVYNRKNLVRIEELEVPYTDMTREPTSPLYWYEDSTFSIDTTDNNNIVFNPLGAEAYEVFVTYRRTPQYLTGNGELPKLPGELHMNIAHKALIYLGLKTNRLELAEIHTQLFDESMDSFYKGQVKKQKLRQGKFI